MSQPEKSVRIPLAITQSLSRKRDPLSRKIADAYAQESRKEWGPEITPTNEELEALEAIAVAIKGDRNASVKMVSAANKLRESIARFRAPTRPEPTPTFVAPPTPAEPPVTQSPPASALDEVMGRFIQQGPQGPIPQGPPTTQQLSGNGNGQHISHAPPLSEKVFAQGGHTPVMEKAMRPPEGAAPHPPGTTGHALPLLFRLIDKEATYLPAKEAAKLRVEVVLDILRNEHQTLAVILERALVDIANI